MFFQKILNVISPASSETSAEPQLPRFTVECQCIDVRITNPMYPNRLIQVASQLADLPKVVMDKCYYDISVKILNFCSRLILDNNKMTTIIIPSSASFQTKSIHIPEYWTNPDTPHNVVILESGEQYKNFEINTVFETWNEFSTLIFREYNSHRDQPKNDAISSHFT